MFVEFVFKDGTVYEVVEQDLGLADARALLEAHVRVTSIQSSRVVPKQELERRGIRFWARPMNVDLVA